MLMCWRRVNQSRSSIQVTSSNRMWCQWSK